tara:strand:- start:529 stop:693 length:165 start_codon:yes stop_codon:yes gene_type:complete
MSELSIEEMLATLTEQQYEEVYQFIQHLVESNIDKKRDEWRRNFPEQARHLDFA